MKGTRGNIGHTQSPKASAHLTGGASGKGKCQYSIGIDYSDFNCVGQAMRNRSSLSSSCSGNYTDRSTHSSCYCALFFIKRGENIFR
jgi:hypothetical protein